MANGGEICILESCLAKAAEGMQFQQAKINLYHSNGRLGVVLNEDITPTGKIISWNDPAQVGYFSREKRICC